MLAERVAAPAAGDVMGFGYCEHLLVWSWRRIVAGRSGCAVMAREFADACGEDGAEVFETLSTFLRALGFASRRRLAIGAPGSLAVTADERQVLTLIAAAQAATPALFEAHLRWLTKPDRRHVLLIATGALAVALATNDLRLEPPETDRPDVCERSLAVA